MVIVDTTVWVDYLRGVENPQTVWLDNQMTEQRLGLTDLILCEVLQGIDRGSTFALVRDELLQFHVFETGSKDQAIAAVQNYRTLQRIGYTVRKTVDCMIATYCLQEGHDLLHRDRDFDAFEKVLGLRVVHP